MYRPFPRNIGTYVSRHRESISDNFDTDDEGLCATFSRTCHHISDRGLVSCFWPRPQVELVLSLCLWWYFFCVFWGILGFLSGFRSIDVSSVVDVVLMVHVGDGIGYPWLLIRRRAGSRV